MLSYLNTSRPPADSRWQYLFSKSEIGQEPPHFECVEKGSVPVLGEVSDLNEWKNHSEVEEGAEIKSDNGCWIVTARIPLKSFDKLRNLQFVKILEIASSVIQPQLHNTTKAIGLEENVIDQSALDNGGKGVIIGIVDFGCDFAHKHFIKESKRTRIQSIWDQSGDFRQGAPFNYGRLYTKKQINDALNESNPYKKLGYEPAESSHGTHVMDIAAGNGSESHPKGIAPKSKIIFVNLALGDKKLASSNSVTEAVKYIFDEAGNRPCVINLSLGQNGGAHDGTGLVEQSLDKLITASSNRAIVIAAGNSYEDQIHTSGKVEESKYVDIDWKISSVNQSENELEIWYSGNDEFCLEIIYKDGSSIANVPLEKNGFVNCEINDKTSPLAYISHRKHDPKNGDNVIHIFQNPSLEDFGGTWKLRLHGKKINANGEFHAWIERGSFSTFPNGNPDYTIGSISTGFESIVVGSYNATKPNSPISNFSSAGPTRDGREKPDLIAPGHHVYAANSKSGDGVVKQSGTSMAAPVVTGLIAQIFGLAKEKKQDLGSEKIKKILLETATSKEQKWDPRSGKGYLSASAINKFLKEFGVEELSKKRKKKIEEKSHLERSPKQKKKESSNET